MPEPLADAKDVTRVFGEGQSAVAAVRQATCRIEPGDRIALVGPSGSGKSTLLHLLAGLDEPTGGSIRWPALGDKSTLRPWHIAFVFQTQSLLAPLSVVENVEIPLLLERCNAGEARTASLDVLKRMDLEPLAEKLPEEISGGQAQRIAVARSLVTSPKVVLADEPTGQLDHATAARLLDLLLANIPRETALVIATHDMTIAQRMEKRWRMDHGVLENSA